MASGTAPRVGIVIVNFRGRDDTLACLESLEALTYPDFFVVLVDNASGDGCLEAVAARFPSVTCLASAENLGFAGGNNLGIAAALEGGAERLLLLNNDTIVAPDLLEPLVAACPDGSGVGIVGAAMYYFDEPGTLWSAGGRVSARGDSTMVTALSEIGELDFVVGCGLMVRRDVVDRIGPMDARYFLYYEETDWCARAREAGWRCITAPQARLWHKISRSTGKDSPLTLYYMRRNRLLYLKRHGSAAGLAAALADDLRLALVWTVQRNPRRHTLLRAVGDFVRGRFGRAEGV